MKFIVLLAICIQLSVYGFLSYRAHALTPPGRVYTMSDLDYYYPDFIRQSKLGAWSIFDPHTTLPTPKIYSYIFFVLAGKVAALANIDPVAMYELLRITGGIALYLATYWFITILLPESVHLLAILFTMIIDTGPLWKNVITLPVWIWGAAMPGQALVARHFGFPHHLWGEAMGLLLVCMILRHIKTPTVGGLAIIFLLGTLGTLTSPPYFVILMLCLFIPWLFYAAITKKLSKTFPPLCSAIFAITLAGVWTKFELAKGPPWDAFVQVERGWWSTKTILTQFIQSFGFYYPFVAILALLIPVRWKSWPDQIRQIVFLAFCWALLPVVLIFFSEFRFFPIVNGRIASDLSPVPIGILAALGVAYATSHSKILVKILLIFVLCISFISSLSYIKHAMGDQEKKLTPQFGFWYTYPTINLWQGIMAMKAVPPYSNVLILPSIGELMPAYVPVRVYAATPHGFLDWWVRRGESHQFYTGEMSKDRLYAFLKENTISYVFYGPEEQAATTTTLLYPDILEIIYINPEVTIFKVSHL